MSLNSFKWGLILGLLTTTKILSSSSEFFNEEVCKLRNIFCLNDYPIPYFNNVLSDFDNKDSNTCNIKDPQDDFVVLKIPFVGSPSFDLAKKMRNKF